MYEKILVNLTVFTSCWGPEVLAWQFSSSYMCFLPNLTRTQSFTVNKQAFVGIVKTLAALNKCVVYPSRITWRSLTLFPMTISLLSSAYQQTLSVPRRESLAHKWVKRTTNLAVNSACSTLSRVVLWCCVWTHFQTPRTERKYDALRSIFDKLQGVWKCGKTWSWVFDISSQSNLKQRRKRRNKRVKIYAN